MSASGSGRGIRRLAVGVFLWASAVTAAHLTWNVEWKTVFNAYLPEAERKLNVAYIPVT